MRCEFVTGRLEFYNHNNGQVGVGELRRVVTQRNQQMTRTLDAGLKKKKKAKQKEIEAMYYTIGDLRSHQVN